MGKMPAIGGDMLTIDDVMSTLNLGRSTILGLRNSYLHPIKLGGRLYYRRDEVDAERERRQSSNKILRRSDQVFRTASHVKPVVETPKVLAVRPPSYDGKIAAQAVRLFREGCDRRDVVEKLEITFELADHLWSQYARMGTEIVLDHKAIAVLQRTIGLPSSPSARDVVELVEALSESVHQRAIEHAASLFAKAPRVRYSRKFGRVCVDVLRAVDLGDGLSDAEGTRTVDVTEILKMTPAEIRYSGWLGVEEDET